MPKKRKDGRYQKKITLSNGKQKIVYGRTIAELNAVADAVRDEDRQGIKVGDNTLVGEWAKLWIEKYKADLRLNTIAMYKNAYNTHIMNAIGDLPIREVRPIHIREVMSKVANKSESLQHKVLITLRQIFDTARQNGLIIKDPTEGIKTTPHTKPNKMKNLNDKQIKTLLKACGEQKAKAFVGLCLYCGLRREEALGIQWNDIDERSLTVNRAVSFINNQPDPSQELKTKAAHRKVPIPAPLKTILGKTPKEGLYVITRANGGIMTETAFRRMWEKIEKSVDFHIHPHMLRHTYATSLYHAGVDLRTAQYLLGHSSVQMTAEIYTHLEQEDGMGASGKIEEYFSEKKRSSS